MKADDHTITVESGDVVQGATLPMVDAASVLTVLFFAGTMTLSGKFAVASLGLGTALLYTYYFLAEERSIPYEFAIFVVWLVWGLFHYVIRPPVSEALFWNTFGKLIRIGVMFFAISGLVARIGSLTPTFLGIILGSTVLLISSFVTGQVASPDMADAGYAVRVSGLLSNPNGFGYALLLAIIGLTYFWPRVKASFIRAAIILLGLGFTVGIIYSASRKAFLGLEIYLVAWSWNAVRRQIRERPWAVFGLIVILVILAGVSQYVYENTYMGARYRMLVEDHNLLGHKRYTLYQEGINLIKKSPVFGYGFGQFEAQSYYQTPSHSDYVEVYVSTGLFGFLLYFSIYVMMLFRVRNVQSLPNLPADVVQDCNVLRAALICVLALAFFRHNVTSVTNWAFLVSIVGYLHSFRLRE